MNIKMIVKQASYVLLCSALLTACSPGTTQTSGTSTEAAATNGAIASSTQTLGYVKEMDKTKIMTFSINVDEAKWQEMLETAAEEEYISADVTINGTTIKNVGIRPKGNSSLKQVVADDTTDRYSFKIKFDEYVDCQTWMGLDKIVVNNMQSDNSYMKEYLSYDIMSYIGVDAPLYAFADIQVNGEAWGFYLAVEVMDGSYLDRTKDGEGELYKPNNDDKMMAGMGNMRGVPAGANGDTAAAGAQGASGNAGTEGSPPQRPARDAVTAPTGMPPADGIGNRGPGGGMNSAQNGVSLVYTDDKASSYSAIFDNAETKTDETDYERVIAALKNLSTGTDLASSVDVDAVLKYFAAHTVVVNMDSYTSNMGHNYYLYENDGQLSMLPWDYNMAFGGFQAGNASEVVNLAIDTPLSGVSLQDRPILGKLLEVPEYKEKYHAYLQEIVNGYFADGKFEQTVANLDQLISSHVQNDPSAFNTYEEYKSAVAELTKLGTLRSESIQGQLKGEIPSTTEGQKADASALVDASAVDLSKLGNGMGKGGPGKDGFGGGPGRFPNGMNGGNQIETEQGSDSAGQTTSAPAN
ncbi:spore coat protein CotH [Paenibacillus sp. H1-7]|uniref:CotH kinase family protein n=1 Tax=Paenibacillus sp. H1-7 TaxID=2282849 RepID=UPI001EF7D025|nr:CotH kinase family protein [Paenibacillus sp. H1-7]ULL18733.1 spore coat protein CotH [Paenibacillus sp. H1-7]